MKTLLMLALLLPSTVSFATIVKVSGPDKIVKGDGLILPDVDTEKMTFSTAGRTVLYVTLAFLDDFAWVQKQSSSFDNPLTYDLQPENGATGRSLKRINAWDEAKGLLIQDDKKVPISLHWCYRVDDVVEEMSADQVKLTGNEKSIEWFYGYSDSTGCVELKEKDLFGKSARVTINVSAH